MSSGKKKRRLLSLCVNIADHIIRSETDVRVIVAAVELKEAAMDALSKNRVVRLPRLGLSVSDTLAVCFIGAIDLDMPTDGVRVPIFKLCTLYRAYPTEDAAEKWIGWVHNV